MIPNTMRTIPNTILYKLTIRNSINSKLEI